jgi:hypothetical protein
VQQPEMVEVVDCWKEVLLLEVEKKAQVPEPVLQVSVVRQLLLVLVETH